MSEGKQLYIYTLQRGLSATVTDVSKHYYGGYWQVAIEVFCNVPVEDSFFNDSATAADARRILGGEVSFARRIEQMAVHQDDLEYSKKNCLTVLSRLFCHFSKMNFLPPASYRLNIGNTSKSRLTAFRV